jgi:hemin uptake protein HemP
MLEHAPARLSAENPPDHPLAGATSPRSPTLQRVDSRRLLAGGRELLIDHGGQEYRLRLTRNDKLILTK